jgi:hypothetical protein
MAITVQNTGDASVFFDDAVLGDNTDNLISTQVDPSQPQVQGLSTTTAPLVTDRHLSFRLQNFDSDLYDLSRTSHLTKLLTALVGGGGAGGLRRQQILARMSVLLQGTNFIELDGFWGALFGLKRAPEEALPTNAAGLPLDPSADMADSATWDLAQARDGRYRARIEQLARGFAQGGTYAGARRAAEAVLGCEVEIVESWVYADYATTGSASFVANTWQAVSQQYGNSWRQLDGVNWGQLVASEVLPISVPLGNRGEIVLVPGRLITDAEKLQLHQVMEELLPASTILTISDSPFISETVVPTRAVAADSTEWNVVSIVQPEVSTVTGAIELYPGGSAVEGARPAFGSYAGEIWAYNGRVAGVTSYALDEDGNKLRDVDHQTVTYSDGTSHDYVPSEALVDSRLLALSRASAEGVLTTFPYAEGRNA